MRSQVYKFILLTALGAVSCFCTSPKHLWHDIPARDQEGRLQMVVEIPTGTVQKYEVNKETGLLDTEMIDGKPRLIKYLGYPANYGMIPQSLLPKSQGGDGDPLDVILLGRARSSGDVIPIQVIGVIRLLDGGEQDDKLIAVPLDDPAYAEVANLDSLEQLYPSATEIIKIWFENYKGKAEVEVLEVKDEKTARTIVVEALLAYREAYP